MSRDEKKASRTTEYKTAAIDIKTWDAVAVWHWGGDHVEHCAICRNQIMTVCIECQASRAQSQEAPKECKVAWGTCCHVFHYHCIQRWLETRNVCPLDNAAWEYRHISDSSS
ncbi:MAG: hypothetical protein Q8P67_19690 [archaeon]|nr:hypothetical protein [archaeon]